MKILRYITFLLFLFAAHACSEAHIGMDTDANKYGVIQGSITDQDGTPLEKIKISIGSEGTQTNSSSYTSSDGRFRCEFALPEEHKQMVIDILIEDIDGQERGGYFETKTTVVTIYEDDLQKVPLIIDLPTYRLSRATV